MNGDIARSEMVRSQIDRIQLMVIVKNISSVLAMYLVKMSALLLKLLLGFSVST